MTSTVLPVDLATWVADRFGPVHLVTDVSWPRAESRVWHVKAGTQKVFVKISPDAEGYARELAGSAFAARALGPHRAPQALACDPILLALATSP